MSLDWFERMSARFQAKCRALALDVVAIFATALCGVVAGGFLTYATYACLQPLYGSVETALSFAAIFGLLAIGAILVGKARQRARRAVATKVDVASESPGALSNHLAEMPKPDDLALLLAALGVLKRMSPAQRLALAFASGFVVGRAGSVARKRASS